MKQVSGRALAKAIERKGWILVRVNGSHHIFVMSLNWLRLGGALEPSVTRTGKANHAMHTDSAITFGFERAITGAELVMTNRWLRKDRGGGCRTGGVAWSWELTTI